MSESQAAVDLTVSDDIAEEQEVATNEANDQPEKASDSTPDSGDNHEEKITFSPEQQAVFDKEIAKKVFKAKEVEREAERKEAEFQAQLRELEAKLPKEQEPEIPDMPDRYAFEDDEQFAKAVQERDEKIAAKIRFDAQQEAAQAQELKQQQAQREQQQQALVKVAENYDLNAKKLGVTPEELASSGQVLNTYGVSVEIADYILRDDQGPLITKYLASNPQEMDSLFKLSPLEQAARIATVIKPNASNLKPKTTDTPDPQDKVSTGIIPNAQRGPKGATFE